MTFAIVHIGKGKTAVREIAPPSDLTLDAPHKPQAFSGVAKFLLRRSLVEQNRAAETAHTNYKPGKLHQLGNDQCKFAHGLDGVMCGARVHIGKSSRSYCEAHYHVVYTGKFWK